MLRSNARRGTAHAFLSVLSLWPISHLRRLWSKDVYDFRGQWCWRARRCTFTQSAYHRGQAEVCPRMKKLSRPAWWFKLILSAIALIASLDVNFRFARRPLTDLRWFLGTSFC